MIATFLAVLDLAQRQAVRVVFGLRPEDFALEPVVPSSAGDGAVEPTEPPVTVPSPTP